MIAAISGALMPMAGLLLAKMIGVLSNPFDPDFRKNSDFYSLMLLILAVVCLIIHTLKKYFATYVAFALSTNIREAVLLKVIISFYFNMFLNNMLIILYVVLNALL